MKHFFFYFLLVLFTACESPLTNHVYDYNEEFEMTLGEEVRIGRERIQVEFVDVLEDSRCPSNVTCVWAGNGKVQIRFDRNNIQLNTYLEPQKVSTENVNIQLVSLEPYPEEPRQFEKEEYKVRLLITKE